MTATKQPPPPTWTPLRPFAEPPTPTLPPEARALLGVLNRMAERTIAAHPELPWGGSEADWDALDQRRRESDHAAA